MKRGTWGGGFQIKKNFKVKSHHVVVIIIVILIAILVEFMVCLFHQLIQECGKIVKIFY